jgi:hypothetical protein
MRHGERKLRIDACLADLPDEEMARVRDQARRARWYEVLDWVMETYPKDLRTGRSRERPSRAAFYRRCSDWDEHEAEYLIRQRLSDNAALTRELEQAGAADPAKLAAALGNDVAAARARGDEAAVARAVRAFKTVASVVGDTRTFELKVKEFEQAQRDFDLRKQDLDIKVRRLELIEAKLREAQGQGATVDPKALADEVDRILGRKA